ncbi:hypothetical protein OG588_22295 [Streptomyces prunicolor]|uniref:hypothetical protein n=1 Tax=Streptomyces prunicolor TaxID=67348 RepID=UPI0038640250|nr:hypothetical protein OG588_22295 [Streptomyces prunicolor]
MTVDATAPTAVGKPDIWDAERCGLLTGAALGLAAAVGTVTDGPTAPDGATTYLVGTPSYVPYGTLKMPCPSDGYRMAEQVMRTVYDPEVIRSVEASPLAGIARRITAVQADRLWRTDATPAANGLARLARVVPRKGGETRELWAEYQRRVPGATDPIVAMRDLWGSVYTWQFIRGDDARLHDLCASMLSLTSAVDFCDALDDSGAGGHVLYMAAASEGLEYLSGEAAALAVREMVAVGGLMVVKDAMAAELASVEGDMGSVTPDEYMGARSWDGAIAPYYRVMLASAHYRHVADDQGELTSAAKCDAIQRAIDNIMRYNDVTDAVADYSAHECFNQLLLALSVRGSETATGYGAALAEVTDAVLECGCGETGHHEAAELSMGACLWYLLTPRYQVRRQLAALTGPGGDEAMRSAYALGTTGTTCRLLPGADLYAPDWTPLWHAAPQREAADRAARIARRALVAPTDPEPCTTAALAVLTACDAAAGRETLLSLAADWQAVFDAALDGSRARDTPYAARLRELVGDFWCQAVLGNGDTIDMDAKLVMDVDEAVRASFTLPAEAGLRVRRAFFGVTSGSAELTAANPFGRLTDGLGVVCR